MSTRLKYFFFILMNIALACGFMHHIIPTETANFERLHIFLFNLCAGGTLLIYFTEDQKNLTIHGKLFCLGALLFALCAFLQWYIPALILPILLAIIVERVRVLRFGHCIPTEMFGKDEPVAKKFHQASLLCLSFGLIFSSPVILNNVYLHLIDIPKLTLDTFFLGFSFPLSLISLSVIFSLMEVAPTKKIRACKEIAFWTINLGVIIFFFFILANLFIPQVVVSVCLFTAVLLVAYLHFYYGKEMQQKAFLLSGLAFLLSTAVTGIFYIILEFAPSYDPTKTLPLLRLHAFTALYGWNISGLAVIARHCDFPLKLHNYRIITLHWVCVFILCPIGFFYPTGALFAVISYMLLTYSFFFKQGTIDENYTIGECPLEKTK